MKIAVLMSTYNGENYIRQQIDSIIHQKGEFELDLFVRDDGSKDDTVKILRQYEAHGDLRWYTGDNLGPAYSFFDLIRNCGEYDLYAFADQDDYWMEDKLNAGMQRLKEYSGPAIYFANAELVDGNLNSLGRNVYRNIPSVNLYTMMCAANVLGCTMIFNHQMAEAIRCKSVPNKMTMHDSYLTRVCVSIGGDLVYDHTPHIKYRQHGSNVVGVSSGIKNIIKSRLHDIVTKAKISIAQQASVILELYADVMSEENKMCLERIASYRNSIWSRISLACSKQTKYSSRNMAFKFRLSILLGNR